MDSDFGQRLRASFSPLHWSLLATSVILVSASCLATFYFFWDYQDKIYPGIKINGVQVGGLSSAEAQAVLAGKGQPAEYILTLRADRIEIASSSTQLGLHYDWQSATQRAQDYGKTGGLLRRLRQIIGLQAQTLDLSAPLSFNNAQEKTFIKELKNSFDFPALTSRAWLKTSQVASSLKIEPGRMGREVLETETLIALSQAAQTTLADVTAPTASTGAQLSPSQVDAATTRATRLVGKQLSFRHDSGVIRVDDQDLISFLQLPNGYEDFRIGEKIAAWTTQVERFPQDAELNIAAETLKVSTFTPPRLGLTVVQDQTRTSLYQQLELLEKESLPTTVEVVLPVATTSPKITLGETNSLGITERIGLGESAYDHSIPTRIHNVALTTTRITNVIIKPGEEYSFNKALGDVSAATGFKPAYVIKGGQTVLGDGGGVCQVSTTLFRSLLNAGLPITKRKAHSYRVSYYELNSKPGLDATVYSGEVDLRFVNDTEQHILIHAEADSELLEMKIELYGTSDGRSTEIVDHKTWDARPAPASVFIPTTSLPSGKTKQIDWATPGIKASFTNVVKDSSGLELRRDTYTSNYVPWSAKYLQGT